MLDRFVEIEGDPEVIQFSGGEPTIHPQLPEMIQAAKDRGIRQVMINTNGVRLARDDRFLAQMAGPGPSGVFPVRWAPRGDLPDHPGRAPAGHQDARPGPPGRGRHDRRAGRRHRAAT